MKRGPEKYLRKNAGVLRKNKREVRIADYVASQVVPKPSRMFERRRIGYRAMGCQKDNSGTLFQ
jgi:hypothetical protein